jgi:hypothetical protein
MVQKAVRVVSLHAGGAGLLKPKRERLELVAGHGASGNRHTGKDSDKAIPVTVIAETSRRR